MRIAFVGSGAIGIFYGVKLAAAGAEVRFLLRGDLAAVRERGSLVVRQRVERLVPEALDRPPGPPNTSRTTRSTSIETVELRPAPVFATTAEIGSVDLVIVTLKTTANGALPALLPPLLGPATAILTLQNGLGPDEFLARHFGPERIMGGMAYVCCTRTGPGEVDCISSVSVTFGEYGRPPAARTREVADLFARAGIKTQLAENLDLARWQKLVWNVPFNGLAIAAGAVPTHRVCGDPALAEEARALMREVQAGAAKLGHTITDDFLQSRYDITPPMGAYRPSSLVDFSAGADVEVESIWGEPLRRGQAAGAAMPRLALLYALLRGMVAARHHA